jgi:peptide/nickel transport system substrate-binding protein
MDAEGHPVKFSILTNAGNAAREKMATLIQQDLAALGMQVTVVTLDFPALIERLMHTQDYEACLLGLENVDPEPNAMMNVWVSSSPNHQWNPSEKTPATPWEAEIDRLMAQQASTSVDAERKKAIDRVQQIVADQQPFIYLVYPNALVAVSPKLQGIQPAVLEPRLTWNVERLHMQEAR